MMYVYAGKPYHFPPQDKVPNSIPHPKSKSLHPTAIKDCSIRCAVTHWN